MDTNKLEHYTNAESQINRALYHTTTHIAPHLFPVQLLDGNDDSRVVIDGEALILVTCPNAVADEAIYAGVHVAG